MECDMRSDDDRLSRKFHPSAPHVTRGDLSEQSIRKRLDLARLSQAGRDALADEQTLVQCARFARNIENFIGTVKVPVGLAGPLRINGTHAQGDYYIPLATTEAALVASYSRGAQVITEAGGCAAALLAESVSRGPAFAFDDLQQATLFASWISQQLATLRGVAEATTRYGKLQSLETTVEGNRVFLLAGYSTGDASGQNMTTIATEALCRYIVEHCPLPVRYWFIEANFSGDKKATHQALLGVRGKRVTADVIVPAALVVQRLHTTADRLAEYSTASAVGAALSGSIGIHGHYANCLAALYIACGQDPACVAESATGISRFELDSYGNLYATVTLPNIMVGTVGGGTGLPSQRACLEILGLREPHPARQLAEVCAGLCLAGELSISAAICADQFTAAHQRLARSDGT